MRTNGYQNYYEGELLAASPLRLVQLLYRGALDSIVSARRHLRLGDIQARSRAITKAMTILNELSGSLDMQKGGELSSNLARLYGYMQRLLMQANFEQREAPLDEAERLLAPLLEAWTDCVQKEPAAGGREPQEQEAHEPVSCAC